MNALSVIEVVSSEKVRCTICPMTWKTLADSIQHDHEMPEGFELYEFEGQGMFVDSIGMPISAEKGFRCGECKNRHHSIKAIKLCHELAADYKAEAEAEYRAMQAETRYYENQGAEEALAQDAYEARNGVIGFREAWHNESPETCPCCN